MNIKKHFFYVGVSVLILYLSLGRVHGDTPFVELQDEYVGHPYTITLYNINDAIKPYLQINERKKPAPDSLFFLSAKMVDEKRVRFFTGEYIDGKSFFPRRNITYAGRVLESFSHLDQYNVNTHLYTVGIFEETRDGIKDDLNTGAKVLNKKYWGFIPSVFYKSTGIDVHERAQLFEQFSRSVDGFVLDYGIGEEVSHEVRRLVYEKNDQISIFGTIQMTIDGKPYYFMGFFQYTFGDEGKCYHRVFKPWTSACLTSLSNSQTQRVIRCAMLRVLSSLYSDYSEIEGPARESLMSFFNKNGKLAKSITSLESAASSDWWVENHYRR